MRKTSNQIRYALRVDAAWYNTNRRRLNQIKPFVGCIARKIAGMEYQSKEQKDRPPLRLSTVIMYIDMDDGQIVCLNERKYSLHNAQYFGFVFLALQM